MPTFAQSFEKSKSYSGIFHINKNMEISVHNKYGDIQVITWEIDSVKFEVDVTVISNKEAKLEKAYGAINVNFKNNNFFTSAETEFVGQGGFWTDVSDISRTIFNSSTTTKVNYIIHIPNGMDFHIVNKYGNVYFGDYNGKINVDLSNGDFKAHYLLGKSTIKQNYGGLFVEKFERTHLELKYTEAQIEECDIMQTKTHASKLYISNVKELDIGSSNDKYYIGSVSKISGSSKFTYLKITSLYLNISLLHKYGAIHFKNLNHEVEHFSLDTYKSDIHLGLDHKNAYLLDFRCVKKPHIQYTAGEYTMTEELLDEETQLKSIKVLWGESEGKKLIPLNINAEEGNIFIDVK